MTATSTRSPARSLRLPAAPKMFAALHRLTGARFCGVFEWLHGAWRLHASQNELSLPVNSAQPLDNEEAALAPLRQALDACHPERNSAAAKPFCVGTHFAGHRLNSASGTFFGVLVVFDTERTLVAPVGLEDVLAPYADLLAPALEQDSAPSTVRSDWQASEGDQDQRLHPSPAAARVLGVMGHDLRNPLHSLLAAIEMLKSKPLEPRALRLTGMVEGSAQRLGELAQANLDFARSQIVGELTVQPEPASDLSTRLKKVIDAAAAAYPQREFDVDLAQAERVFCDAPRVAQGFSSILTHGIRHAAVEGAIIVRTEMDGTGDFALHLDIPGYILEPDLISHLFDPFYFAEGEAKTAQFGIGLYLAERIALAHGGSLRVVRNAAGDARFTMQFPQAPSAT